MLTEVLSLIENVHFIPRQLLFIPNSLPIAQLIHKVKWIGSLSFIAYFT